MSNTTNEALDRLAELDRERDGTGTDYALSKLLLVSRAAVSRWRKGLSQMDDDAAIRAAELLEEDPAWLLTMLHAERCTSMAARKHWYRIAKMHRAEHAAA